jgi:hypothetical protein
MIPRVADTAREAGMRAGTVGRLLAAWMVATLPAAAGAEATRATTVVTPATPVRWMAPARGWIVFQSPAGDGDRVEKLQRWAREDRFDPGRRLQAQLLEQLAKRGRLAVPLRVERPPQLVPSPLARDALPEAPLPGDLLDVSLEGFGMAQDGIAGDYVPLAWVAYRVVDPRGRVDQPTRRIVYFDGKPRRGAEAVEPDPACRWKSFATVGPAPERARLWGCYDSVFERIAARIAERLAGPAAAEAQASEAGAR